MNKTLIVAVAVLAMCAVASAQYEPVYRTYPVQQQQQRDQFYNDIQQYDREAPRMALHEREEPEDREREDRDQDEEEEMPRFREMRAGVAAEESSEESSEASKKESSEGAASEASKESSASGASKAEGSESAKASGASESGAESSKKSEESSEASKKESSGSEESSGAESSKKSEESSEASKKESSEGSEGSEASKKESSEHVVKERAVPAFNIDTPAIKEDSGKEKEDFEKDFKRNMHVTGDDDEEEGKDKELAEALQSVKDHIVHKATQIKSEKKWVREVTQIIEHYVLKTRRVNLNIHTLQKDVKTLYRRKKQIENIVVQRRLEKKLKIANSDLQTLQNALKSVHKKENQFDKSKTNIKQTLSTLTTELRKLRGEPAEGEEGAAADQEMSEMAEASAAL